MVELLREDEGQPDSYPTLPGSVSNDAAAAISAATVWQRIEDWIAHRWNERTVTWIVRGPGCWEPPLQPATVDTTEEWNESTHAWESVTLDDAPVGSELEDATYRITATVGSTETPPELVQEAVRRLAEYLYQVQQDPVPGHTSVTDGDYNFDRSAGWAARAIHNSGAADLLRGYRLRGFR